MNHLPEAAPTPAAGRILVAGIGNIFYGDDGFGVEVAARLMTTRLPERVRVIDVGIRSLHLAYELLDGGYDLTILVDTISRGGLPGTVYLLEPDIPARDAVCPPDAHVLGPDGVLALLEQMGGSVGSVLIVGCEPARFDTELGLSPPVAAAVDEAVQLVVDLAERADSPA